MTHFRHMNNRQSGRFISIENQFSTLHTDDESDDDKKISCINLLQPSIHGGQQRRTTKCSIG